MIHTEERNAGIYLDASMQGNTAFNIDTGVPKDSYNGRSSETIITVKKTGHRRWKETQRQMSDASSG